jgi:iron complex transport system substrate-binding protein
MQPRCALAPLILAAAGLLLAGCDARKTQQSAATPMGNGVQAPAAAVTDDTGVKVRLRPGPLRILSVTPGATEMLFAAGAGSYIVATVDTSDVPEAARKIARIGDATALDYEKVIQAHASVAVVWEDINSATMIEKLTSLGLPIYKVRAETLRDIPRSIERLSALSATASVAAAAAAALDHKLDGMAVHGPSREPLAVFYQIWEGPIYTIGGHHIISDALRYCGAHNIFEDLKWPANIIGREAIIKRDPDVIILSAPVLTAREWASYWDYYPAMRAVANKKVQAWTDGRLDRMGPGAIDAAEDLCTTLDKLRPATATH